MKYGYRMCNCTIEELHKYKQHCYNVKKPITPIAEFGAVQFTSVKQAIAMIRHILIPQEHNNLADTSWTLAQENTMLLKEMKFEIKNNATLYQEAVERAWALGGHLDPRTEQSYHE